MGPKKLVGKKMGKKVPAKGRALTRQKKKPLRLKLGGIYLNREGRVRGPLTKTLEISRYGLSHPYRDAGSMDTYTRSGRYLGPHLDSGWDLISEAPARKASRKGAAK